jgi:hypothetical protein
LDHLRAGRVQRPAISPSPRALARAFRRWLAKAKVTRAELHTGTQARKAITFYDLRATGITWRAVRGNESFKIMRAPRHTATTQIDIREAVAVETASAARSRNCRRWPKTAENRPRFVLRWLSYRNFSGVDGTRTRGLRRDRPAL